MRKKKILFTVLMLTIILSVVCGCKKENKKVTVNEVVAEMEDHLKKSMGI